MRARHLRSLLATLTLAGLCAAVACGTDGAATVGEPDAADDATVATADGAAGEDSSSLDATLEDAGDAGDATDAGDASLLSPSFVHRDINHVLATGQSLSVGSQGIPALSTTQPYANTMFVTGVIAGGINLTSFVPLTETTVETMSSAFASHITKDAREVILLGQSPTRSSHDLLVSAHGIGGQPYAALKKGGTLAAYANGMAQLQAGHALALAAGKSHVVRAVTNVHGESDSNLANASYLANLLEWQSDYEADVKAVTGQTEGVPMLHTQFSSWTRLTGLPATSIIPAQQLAAHVTAPGKVVLVGAKYHLPYVADGVHLTNAGYRQMGEDYAKVYRRVILEGKPWEPVRPRTITRAGAVVTVAMHVPAPPLVLDTTLVTDPGAMGFEWTDDGPATPTIASVAVTSPDTVVITLSAVPTGANRRLRYAFTGISGARGGPTSGPRGNLRDSDTTPSRDGYKLYNWCVHFDAAAP